MVTNQNILMQNRRCVFEMIIKLTDKKREELGAKMMDFRVTAEEGNRNTFERMTKCERFKVGKQWDKDVLEKNKYRRKHSLVINKVLPVVLQIVGTEVQNPRNIKVHNVKAGTQTVANILTGLARHVMDSEDNNGQYKKTQMFDDGITTARGWLGLDIDYKHDPVKGNLIVKDYDPFMVLVDPACTKYDLNSEEGGAKYLITDEWVDKEKLETQYPQHKSRLMGADYSSRRESSGPFSRLVNYLFNNPVSSVTDDYRDQSQLDNPVNSKSDYNYRESITWWKEWKKGLYLQRQDDPLNFLAITGDKEMSEAKQLAEENPDRVRIVSKDRRGKPLVVPVLNKTVMVGDFILEHDVDPFNGLTNFPLVRFSPYFSHGYEFGIVENLIDPQQQVNWSWSMELNLTKLLANTGWIVGSAIGKALNFLKVHGGEDGIILSEKDYGGKIEKMKLNEFPAGFDVMTEKGSRHIAQISNVRMEEPQFDDKNMSGKAIALKQQSSMTGSAKPFANYDYTMRLFGNLTIDMIRHTDVYSEDEIKAIIDEEDLIDARLLDEARQIITSMLGQVGYEIPTPPDMTVPEMVDAAEVEAYQKLTSQLESEASRIAQELIFAEIQNIGKGRYGTTVDQMAMGPTMRIQQSIETFELNKALIESNQPGVARRLLIEATDVPNKEEIIAEVPQMAGAA